MSVTAESIYERLKKAQEDTLVVLTIEGRPNIVEMKEASPPESCWEGRQRVDCYMDEGIWQTKGLGFQQLKEWVEVHWNPEDKRQAPGGTVATGEDWGWEGEIQLDAANATRKLIAAAKLFGRDEVGKYVAEFATHGMIEVRRIYLLKGPSIKSAKPLDECCTLLPYREAWRKIDAESDPGDSRIVWPEPHTENICALEGRYFERGRLQGEEYSQYTSPLLKDGPQQLALLLGLVWGTGFRLFGSSYGVPAAAAAALPYRYATGGWGSGTSSVALALQGYGPQIGNRPLAIQKLHDLTAKYSEIPEKVRRRLERAMGRLRDSTERINEEDMAIDLGIALKILFMEDDQQGDLSVLIPQRAAWHYADSESERRQTEDTLGRFYRYHSEVVHGRASEELCAGDQERNAKLLSDTNNVLRACLMTMIAEGQPEDWCAAEQPALRFDPPRAESEIPSVKSDPLSWSVEEQREIDQVMESVWKPIVEEAPPPPPNEVPSTVAGLAPELVERYREQRIPYVVIHPARLYMAHPKWPKTASDPLDERARYYCEIDVERHTRQWVEAAASKGLVRFEVSTDADMYHPNCRDDWPRPLLSSHEEDSAVQIAGRRMLTGEKKPKSHDSTGAVDTKDRRHSAAEEKLDVPSPELPTFTVSELEREWSRLWREFRHDVNVATNSLLYMLGGIHKKHLAEQQRLTQAMNASDDTAKTFEDAVGAWGDSYCIPTYPKLRAFPALKGEPLFIRAAPDGPMEQTAFKGWVSEVYDRWESHYRTQLKHEIQKLPGAIRPRQQVLGDLRHIRNNLLHNGIAKRREAANCEILRWFTDGERMQVRLRHVFDFLNQMGWMSEGSIVILEGQERGSGWDINRDGELEEPTPALISVRPVVNPEQRDPRYRYEASVVFENGVFGRVPMGPEREETEAQARERTHKWMKMMINEQGDLSVPDLGTVPAIKLYLDYLKGKKYPAPGIWQPWVQFRDDST